MLRVTLHRAERLIHGIVILAEHDEIQRRRPDDREHHEHQHRIALIPVFDLFPFGHVHPQLNDGDIRKIQGEGPHAPPQALPAASSHSAMRLSVISGCRRGDVRRDFEHVNPGVRAYCSGSIRRLFGGRTRRDADRLPDRLRLAMRQNLPVRANHADVRDMRVFGDFLN